jgi:hypothetical protein
VIQSTNIWCGAAFLVFFAKHIEKTSFFDLTGVGEHTIYVGMVEQSGREWFVGVVISYVSRTI